MSRHLLGLEVDIQCGEISSCLFLQKPNAPLPPLCIFFYNQSDLFAEAPKEESKEREERVPISEGKNQLLPPVVLSML